LKKKARKITAAQHKGQSGYFPTVPSHAAGTP